MRLMGIDPSFSSMGIAMIDTETKQITFERIKGEMGSRYQEIFYQSVDRSKAIVNLVKEFKPDIVHSEEPLPQATSSSGLFMLDSMLFYSMMLAGVPKIMNSHPTHLRHLHEKKYTKTDSVNLAKEMIEVFYNAGYKTNKTRFNNDEAEAFIYLCRLYYSTHKDVITEGLLRVCPNIKNKKEKQLYPRLKQ